MHAERPREQRHWATSRPRAAWQPSRKAPRSWQPPDCCIAPCRVPSWHAAHAQEQRHWDISSSERLEILRKFVAAGLEHWGSDERGVETTRRFLLEWLSYLCRYGKGSCAHGWPSLVWGVAGWMSRKAGDM
eukprot:351537-Chlamydomonas_euryale.AAC.5